MGSAAVSNVTARNGGALTDLTASAAAKTRTKANDEYKQYVDQSISQSAQSNRRDKSANVRSNTATSIQRKPTTIGKMHSPVPMISQPASSLNMVVAESDFQSAADSKTVFSVTQMTTGNNLKGLISLGLKNAGLAIGSGRVLERIRGKVATKLAEKISCLGYGNIL